MPFVEEIGSHAILAIKREAYAKHFAENVQRLIAIFGRGG